MIALLHAVTFAHAQLEVYASLAATCATGEPLMYSATIARAQAASALAKLVMAIVPFRPTANADLNERLHRVAWTADKLAAQLAQGAAPMPEVSALLEEMEALRAIAATPARIVKGAAAPESKGTRV